jgi:L-threonylcarbamoyladenylate synthase
MSQIHTPKGVHRIAAPTTVEQFARELYSGMREADRRGFLELVINTPKGAGLEVAILDRVIKSSRGRSGEASTST